MQNVIIIDYFIIDKKTCDSRALSSISPTVTLHTPTQNEHSDPIAVPIATKAGPSEYSKMRKANIAENKKLLASLGLGEGAIGILGESLKKKKKKK